MKCKIKENEYEKWKYNPRDSHDSVNDRML